MTFIRVRLRPKTLFEDAFKNYFDLVLLEEVSPNSSESLGCRSFHCCRIRRQKYPFSLGVALVFDFFSLILDSDPTL